MQIRSALDHAARLFRAAGFASAGLEARMLISHLLNQPVEYWLIRDQENLSSAEEQQMLQLINRRLNFEPLAYIIGYREFYRHQFKVNQAVLIPRPDTEILVEAALKELPVIIDDCSILDLGTGSGCIIISLLLSVPFCRGVASDVSCQALKVAAYNRSAHKLERRLTLACSNWFDDLVSQKFDMIVSNPPYINRRDKHLMNLETINYEPSQALFAAKAGLAAYYLIARTARQFLKPSGKLLVEVGFNQASLVSDIFTTRGYSVKEIYRDLAGRQRVICLTN